MGNRIRGGVVALAMTALLGGAALAASPQWVERFDSDKSGRVDPAEWEAHRAQRKADTLKKFDANKNGALEPVEQDAAMKAHKAERAVKMKEHFTSMDKNKDGKLVAAEVDGRMSRHFAKIDANKDGALTWAEVEAAKVGGGKHGKHGRGDCRGGKGAPKDKA